MTITPKTKKILMIAGIVAALVAVWYFFLRKKSDPIQTDETLEVSNGSELNKPPIRELLPNASFPLKSGSYGNQVQHLQAALNLQFGSGLATDGKFGNNTLSALNKNYPRYGGVVSYANYRAIYSKYGTQIQNYLKERK